MKFIVDAQLPKKLATWLRNQGYGAIHTLEMPNRNATTDEEINQLSMQEKRIVISKDADFYNRYFDKLEPHKLIFLTTGNISTKELIEIFEKNIEQIIEAIDDSNVIEITKTNMIVIA